MKTFALAMSVSSNVIAAQTLKDRPPGSPTKSLHAACRQWHSPGREASRELPSSTASASSIHIGTMSDPRNDNRFRSDLEDHAKIADTKPEVSVPFSRKGL